MPFRTRLSFTRGTPRGLFGSSRFDGDPFIIGEFVAHDSSPQFRRLNHGSPAKRNAPGPSLIRCLRRTSTSPQSLQTVENDPNRTQCRGQHLHGKARGALTSTLCIAKIGSARRNLIT